MAESVAESAVEAEAKETARVTEVLLVEKRSRRPCGPSSARHSPKLRSSFVLLGDGESKRSVPKTKMLASRMFLSYKIGILFALSRYLLLNLILVACFNCVKESKK